MMNLWRGVEAGPTARRRFTVNVSFFFEGARCYSLFVICSHTKNGLRTARRGNGRPGALEQPQDEVLVERVRSVLVGAGEAEVPEASAAVVAVAAADALPEGEATLDGDPLAVAALDGDAVAWPFAAAALAWVRGAGGMDSVLVERPRKPDLPRRAARPRTKRSESV